MGPGVAASQGYWGADADFPESGGGRGAMAVAARLPSPTPENALQSWIDRHIEALHVDSQQALRNLQGQWRTQGLPHPQQQPASQEEEF